MHNVITNEKGPRKNFAESTRIVNFDTIIASIAALTSMWSSACAEPVDSQRTSLRTTGRILPRLNLCTIFVPSLWVITATYTRLLRSLCAQFFDLFTPVNKWVIPSVHIANNNYYLYI